MTDKYAVLGNPISHSKSPLIHTLFAEQTGQDMSYEAIEVPLDGFTDTVQRLREEGYKGCNVTVPFKYEAYKLAKTELSERAQVARALNTLKFQGDTIIGDNTDGIGLVRDIQINRNFSLRNQKVLLLGAGGAAWGVAMPLLIAGAKIYIYNRTPSKARKLSKGVQTFLRRDLYTRIGLKHGLPNFLNSYAELSGRRFHFIINATSAGLTESSIFLPPTIFADALAYDMMYGSETPFMAFARKHGAAIVADGLGMLVEQAAEAFYLWRNVRPDTRPVLEKLRK